MLRTVALSALLAATVPAQSPPCLAENDQTTSASNAITAFGFGGQNSFAWQITPTSTLVVLAARVFTENTTLTGDRFMAVEIWDDQNAAPGTRLAGGGWRIDNNRPESWQGANLDQPIVLTQGVPVWLVWVEPGFSQPMTEPGGATQLPHQTRSGTGAWTPRSASAPKFRLFCNYLDDVNSAPAGSGCPLSTNRIPTAYTNEAPQIGNGDFLFESSGTPAGGAVFAVIGVNPNFPATPVLGLPAGCDQLTDAVASLLLFAGNGDTRGPDFAGHAELDFPIPNNPGLVGAFFAVQFAPIDPGATAPLPFGTSNAHRITLF